MLDVAPWLIQVSAMLGPAELSIAKSFQHLTPKVCSFKDEFTDFACSAMATLKFGDVVRSLSKVERNLGASERRPSTPSTFSSCSVVYRSQANCTGDQVAMMDSSQDNSRRWA